MMFFLSFLISFVMVLFSVMFITLLERKILSYSQLRVGPNKVIFLGLAQPLLDGVKLFFKEIIFVYFSNKALYFFGPTLFFLIMGLIWLTLPSIMFSLNFLYSFMFFILCVGLGVYVNLFSGWAANSKYSMVGAVRAMAQTISYEVSLALVLFCVMSFFSNFMVAFYILFKFFFVGALYFPVFLIWYISVVAECNRAPFDFAEGESELVSGFNVEYGSSGFALLFIGEYGMIIFFSIFSYLIFFSVKILWVVMIFFLLSLMLFIRAIFPRFRYDKLMSLAWFKMLPCIIFLGLFYKFL